MQSFRSNPNARRKTFLRLAGEIESQLRDAYDRKFRLEGVTQSSLAEKLGINRSAVHHRLMGQTNMTIETIADMVWALGCSISVKIADAQAPTSNYGIESLIPAPQLKTKTTEGTIAFAGIRKKIETTQQQKSDEMV